MSSANAEAAATSVKSRVPSRKRKRSARATKRSGSDSAERWGAAKSKGTRGRHHTPAERAEILQAAAAGGLTGAQAAKRYGISIVTYYMWRKNAGLRGLRGRQAGATSVFAPSNSISESVRTAVALKVREVLPGIVRSEVARALELLLKVQ